MESLQNTSLKSPEYRNVPISQLIESPTNPRKRYDQAGLEELAESIRAHGILEPLVVRTVGETVRDRRGFSPLPRREDRRR